MLEPHHLHHLPHDSGTAALAVLLYCQPSVDFDLTLAIELRNSIELTSIISTQSQTVFRDRYARLYLHINTYRLQLYRTQSLYLSPESNFSNQLKTRQGPRVLVNISAGFYFESDDINNLINIDISVVARQVLEFRSSHSKN